MPDGRLEKALNDVPAESSPADENLDASQDPSAAPSGEQGSTGDGDKQEGRTLDNVRGEFMRKLAQRDDAVADLQAEIRALRTDLQSKPDTPAQPAQSANQTIDQMSLTELRTLRRGLPDDTPTDQVQQLDDYITDRAVEDKARELYRNESTRDQYARLERKANEKAMDRWPELRKRSGPFFAKVNQVLQDRGNFAENDPEAVLNAANEVGFQLGLTPAGKTVDQRKSAGNPTNVAGSANTPASHETHGGLDDDEIAQLSERLRGALPAGKKFDPDAIKKRDQFYARNHNQYERRNK